MKHIVSDCLNQMINKLSYFHNISADLMLCSQYFDFVCNYMNIEIFHFLVS